MILKTMTSGIGKAVSDDQSVIFPKTIGRGLATGLKKKCISELLDA